MPHRTRRFSPLALATLGGLTCLPRLETADQEAIPFRRPRPHAAPGGASSRQEDWLGGSSVRRIAGAGAGVFATPELFAGPAPLVWPRMLRAIWRPATPDERAWARASESPWAPLRTTSWSMLPKGLAAASTMAGQFS